MNWWKRGCELCWRNPGHLEQGLKKKKKKGMIFLRPLWLLLVFAAALNFGGRFLYRGQESRQDLLHCALSSVSGCWISNGFSHSTQDQREHQGCCRGSSPCYHSILEARRAQSAAGAAGAAGGSCSSRVALAAQGKACQNPCLLFFKHRFESKLMICSDPFGELCLSWFCSLLWWVGS